MGQGANNKELYLIEIMENNIHFKTKYHGQSKNDFLNALLIEKIEKEKGFAGVWEFLSVGPFENSNDKYFRVLEKLTGITKKDYNEKILELIKNKN